MEKPLKKRAVHSSYVDPELDGQTMIIEFPSRAKTTSLEAAIREREDALSNWISENGESCFSEQLHFETDSSERMYWHHGYLMALRDVINQLSTDQDIFH